MAGRPIAINLYGAPGAGKSTAAARLFGALKERHLCCELVTEFAKDLVWDGNDKALHCQPYILGTQYYRMMRCADNVDVLITDSPLLLSIVYNKDPALCAGIELLAAQTEQKFHSINFYLELPETYDCTGRIECAQEAAEAGRRIRKVMDRFCPGYLTVPFGKARHQTILHAVIRWIMCGSEGGRREKF